MTRDLGSYALIQQSVEMIMICNGKDHTDGLSSINFEKKDQSSLSSSTWEVPSSNSAVMTTRSCADDPTFAMVMVYPGCGSVHVAFPFVASVCVKVESDPLIVAPNSGSPVES